MVTFDDEQDLIDVAVRLGARTVAGWSAAEQCLAEAAGGRASHGRNGPGAGRGEEADRLAGLRALILAGGDPLGDALCRIRPPAHRRATGQVLTPRPVVDSMIAWAARTLTPARVVDPGAASARFLVAAGRRWPAAALAGVETDPVAAIIGRATLATAGMAGRATITVADYRSLCLPRVAGPTLFIGNPPYVRHHQIPPAWKEWLHATAAGRGLTASGLAGLHAHFFLATAAHAVPGDAGVLVTAAEWLDANYGSLIRSLLLGPLGGCALHLLDPAVPAFADAAATSVITCFLPGASPPSMRLRQVATPAGLGCLSGGTATPAAAMRAARRWGPLLMRRAGARTRPPAGFTELGELCRVHRGQVTGANKIWITTAGGAGLPARWLLPAVTRASELLRSGGMLASADGLRRVIDLPADLAGLTEAELALVTGFLERARAAGAADSYVARHRAPWWRVGLRAPAPILATYMARRPPAFVRNPAGARHVNIAHGLYPRQELPPSALDGLAAYLSGSVTAGQGRTYAGGLAKFEPGDMERLPVPGPELLPSDPAVIPHARQPLRVGDGLGGDDRVEVTEVEQDDEQVDAGDAGADDPPPGGRS